MKAWLKPLFGDGYADVELRGLLLPVGRGDAAFHSYPDEFRLQLAERHARLFLDGDILYVVDLDSGSGTQLNGESVGGDPVAVAAGDVLCFGKDVCFEAGLVEADEPTEESAGPIAADDDDEGERTQILTPSTRPRLLLLPVRSGKGLNPIAVSVFPFLVSKSTGHFAVYVQQFAAESNFVSRRHAHIYARGADLYIEDLGSTNGTLLNDRRLDGAAEQLNTDDILQFGHELFTFKVVLEAVPVEDGNAAATRRTVPEGTILVSKAASFLDVYCDKPEPEQAAQDDQPPAREQSPLEQLKAAVSALRDRSIAVWEQLPLSRELRLAVVALGVVVLLGGFAAWLFADDRVATAAELLAEEQYEPALLLVEGYLAEHPGDEAAQLLADDALQGYVVPAWSQVMLSGDYQAAEDLLRVAQSQAPSQGDDGVLPLLHWLVALQRYTAERDAVTSIRLSEGDHPMGVLLQRWEANSDDNLRLLEDLARAHPIFDPIRTDALSQLRALKSDASVLLDAMTTLRHQVLQPLDPKTGAAALTALETFERDYPRVSGAEAWRADVRVYLALKAAHAEGELADYMRERQAASFNTDYFAGLVTAELPELDELQAVAGDYALADRQWQAGELAPSLALLEKLAQGPWGKEARSLFAQRQQLRNDFLRLPDLYQTEDYQTSLLDFYTRIDPQRDKFMFDALRSDFSNEQEFAELRVSELRSAAEEIWQAYQAQGGISGALRLESQISERYREQAGRLREAYSKLQEAAQILGLLGAVPSDAVSELKTSVVSEATRQRAAIEDLSAVLGSAAVDNKSALLPATLEEPQ